MFLIASWKQTSQAAYICKTGQRKYRNTAGWKGVFSNKTKHFSFLVLKTPKAWIFTCQAESLFVCFFFHTLHSHRLMNACASTRAGPKQPYERKLIDQKMMILKGYRLTFLSRFSTLLPAELTCVFNHFLMSTNVFHAYFRKYEKHVRFQ